MGFGHTRSVKAAQKTGQKRGQNAAKDAGRRLCFDVVVASPRARPKAASGVFGLTECPSGSHAWYPFCGACHSRSQSGRLRSCYGRREK